jgi:hypothetical protein
LSFLARSFTFQNSGIRINNVSVLFIQRLNQDSFICVSTSFAKEPNFLANYFSK